MQGVQRTDFEEPGSSWCPLGGQTLQEVCSQDWLVHIGEEELELETAGTKL